jgi:hypothetical protein
MTKVQNCTLQFDEKTASVDFVKVQSGVRFGRPIWKPNAWLDPLEIFFYYSIFTLFHAGFVLFTVNGLNWPQS